jgi:hypothetical protein
MTPLMNYVTGACAERESEQFTVGKDPLTPFVGWDEVTNHLRMDVVPPSAARIVHRYTTVSEALP